MRRLKNITIRGLKSIREQTLELDKLNVFIGGNGAGKSNLVGAFQLLHEVVNQRLTDYSIARGGASSLFHFGRKITSAIEIELSLRLSNSSVLDYKLQIEATDEGLLFVKNEEVNKQADGSDNGIILPNSRLESRIKDDRDPLSKQLFSSLDSFRVYHFHDTSETAAVKGHCAVEDNRLLRPRAENLAAYLYFLQQKHPEHLALIEDTIRQIAPFFDGFRLAPSRLNEDKIRLEWQEKGQDGYFNATALSDGTLRFICLTTLLLQPEEDLPTVLLLDEPELGLHPAAVALLADLLSSCAEKCQVIVATQSVTLINQLHPEQVWTVDRENAQSVFRQLNENSYRQWLDDYSLGELWEKNLLNARP
ncbi:AAA family ATPase [Roseibacillus ishigakijimensis]|nr:AAA family ATPase [Roseibacillus ishigakijimensis]